MTLQSWMLGSGRHGGALWRKWDALTSQRQSNSVGAVFGSLTARFVQRLYCTDILNACPGRSPYRRAYFRVAETLPGGRETLPKHALV
jgi:hypothetical protein